MAKVYAVMDMDGILFATSDREWATREVERIRKEGERCWYREVEMREDPSPLREVIGRGGKGRD